MNPLKIMLSILAKENIQAYITNIADPHLNEFISPCDMHVAKMTGFTGSNGLAILSEKEKVLYTDSRYFIQAKNELKDFKLKKYKEDEKVSEYLKKNFAKKRIGIDKKRISHFDFLDLKSALKEVGSELIHFGVENLFKEMPEREFKSIIDLEKIRINDLFLKNSKKSEIIFSDNPEVNTNLVQANNLTGSLRREKIRGVQSNLEEEALLVTELDSIAWLLNLRGSDIPYNPVFYSFLIVSKEECTLFTDAKIEVEGIKVKKYSEVEEEVKKYNKMEISNECNAFLTEGIKDYKFIDSLVEKKSIKNEIELEGMKLAHLLDGAALSFLFGWLEKELEKRGVSEKEVSGKLKEIKEHIGGFVEESFETICGAGKNAAIVHHKAGNDLLEKEKIILLDSGSQYFFGTTDVTRTLHFGTPKKEEKENYTKVLKGFLLAKNAKVPSSSKLSTLDTLARTFLWRSMLDYGHGTSHGVGHFLNVHESPPSFNDALKVNQVISIEPGYYKEEEYGIRIEDLVYVEKEENNFIKFTSLTCVPFHLSLIDRDMLSEEEKSEINAYSQFVRKEMKGLLEKSDGFSYLMRNTEMI